MAISLHCDHCQFSTNVKEKYAGQRVRCPKCKELIQLPELAGLEIPVEDIIEPASPTGNLITPVQTTSEKQSSSPKHIPIIGGVVLAVALLAGVFYWGRSSSGTNEVPSISQDGNSAEEPAQQAGTLEANQAASSQLPPPETQQLLDAGSNQPAVQPNLNVSPPRTSSTTPVTPTNSAAVVPVKPTPLLNNDLQFEILPLEEPVSFMAMTEDGRHLLLSHQSANRVTVFDIANKTVVEELNTPSPKSVLCRAGKIFVANVGEATVSEFSKNDGRWIQSNEYQVDKPNVVHISAPQSRNFKGKLLVTCHGTDRKASYQDSHIYVLDLESDECKKVSSASMASYSYDGKLAVTQGSFNLSPSGGVTAYVAEEFESGTANPFFRGGIQQTPYVYQAYPGSYWFGTNMIFGGNPLAEIHKNLGRIVVPDQLQKVVYVVDEDLIKAHQLNTAFNKIGQKRASYSSGYDKKFDHVYHRIYRKRGYILDHPVACTLGGKLSIFLLDLKGGLVLAAEATAFKETPFGSTASVKLEPPAKADTPKEQTPHRPTPLPTPTATRVPSFDVQEKPDYDKIFRELPKYAPVGESLSLQLEIPKDVELAMMSGPDGLNLNSSGSLKWTPKANQVGEHELKIRVRENKQQAFVRPKIEVIDRELFDAVGGDLSKLSDFQSLPLSVDRYSLANGIDGKSLLLLQGRELRIIDASGRKVQKTIKLPNRYKLLEEREKFFVCAIDKPPAIDVVDKRSLKVIKHIPLKTTENRIREITDLAINPVDDRSYAAVKLVGDLPRYHIFEINESQGKARPNGMIGKWIEISADGRRAYTGYSDIYQNGIQFHLNPGWRLIEIPEYGNIDMLIEWNLANTDPIQVVRNAGGNGKGIRLSADGHHIVYLSHVGLPMHSGNLTCFKTVDFSSETVLYETNKIGSTNDLTFHPRLPIVASPGSGSAVLFHQESGKQINNKLLLTSSGLGEVKVEKILFSPDGRSLLFVCATVEGKYIRAVKLKLTEKEKNAPPPKPRRTRGATA